MSPFVRDLSSVVAAAGTVVVALSVLLAWWTYKKEQRNHDRQARERHYQAIDQLYFELLRVTIEFPYLRSAKFIQQWDSGVVNIEGYDEDRTLRYEAYAFMVWNFLETIYDRCQGPENYLLSDTWQPVFTHDGLLHLAWFRRPENKRHFKEQFQKYVERRFNIQPNVDLPLPGVSSF